MSENHAPVAVSPAGHTSNGATIVALHGEIDPLTATPLAERLDALTAHPNPDLVLDLRSVTFIDCAGLSVLCRARNRTLTQQGRLRLVSDSPGFRHILCATGLGGVFEVQSQLPRRL
ncbi:STAS domain-containing protein [Streptomyces sp. NBC_00365]|uniref:STAS domain-containing protein n=1 Tax=Streptomyces sp. NBC_00365 TaxID=2975726 RepID=UPI00225BEF30|nr:STAS domain-containing protein [Streptomyces sp. NBC_00365]MCX5095968.1 STAS domain-containing protein [Streptomyces sp. NBC_00365]